MPPPSEADRSRELASAGLREIAPATWCLGPHGRSQTNVYLVGSGPAWCLIDAGWAGDAPRIEAAAARLFGSGSRPAAILLTHSHPDHAGAATRLARAWDVPVFVHRAEVGLATADWAAIRRYGGPLDDFVIVPILHAMGRRRRERLLAKDGPGDALRVLETGGRVAGLPDWEWVHVPGHTPGHVAYWRPADRVAITGDAIVTLRVNAPSGMLLGSQGLSGPPWYTTWDSTVARASITAIAALEPAVLAGGHGAPLVGPGTTEALRAFAERSNSAERRSRSRR